MAEAIIFNYTKKYCWTKITSITDQKKRKIINQPWRLFCAFSNQGLGLGVKDRTIDMYFLTIALWTNIKFDDTCNML